jgi:heme/copper-type cytochrome/quinol oxidase subunit 2
MPSKIVAHDVYGYIIVSSIAVIIAVCGIAILIVQSRKELDKRNPGMIILGICLGALGMVVVFLSILFLSFRGTNNPLTLKPKIETNASKIETNSSNSAKPNKLSNTPVQTKP